MKNKVEAGKLRLYSAGVVTVKNAAATCDLEDEITDQIPQVYDDSPNMKLRKT